MADLLIHDAWLVATVDDDRRELAGGWVAITDGLVTGVGASDRPHAGRRASDLAPRDAWSPRAWSTPTTISSRT